jgi:hypothetical protein
VLRNVVDVAFHRTMAALGIAWKKHTVHDLRDTFATLHLMSNTPLLWVSDMLGHARRSVTLDRYAKWIPQASAASYASVLQRPDYHQVAAAAAASTLPPVAPTAPQPKGEGRRLAAVPKRRGANWPHIGPKAGVLAPRKGSRS